MFSREELALLAVVRRILEKIPPFNFGSRGEHHDDPEPILPSCHMWTRGFAGLYGYGLKVEDGSCGKVWHSWLRTKQGNILDVDPIGCIADPKVVMPILVWTDNGLGIGSYLYHPKPTTPLQEMVRESEEVFEQRARVVADKITSTARRLRLHPAQRFR